MTKIKFSIPILCENTSPVNILPELKNLNVDRMFVPNNYQVKSYMDLDYRTALVNNDFKPIRGNFNDINDIKNKSYFIDLNNYINSMEDKFNIRNYSSPKGSNLISTYLSNVDNIKDNKKVLLYVIDLDKEFDQVFSKRKFYPIYNDLYENKNSPSNILYDMIVSYVFSKDRNINRYMILFNKSNENINVGKIKQYLTSFKYDPIKKIIQKKVSKNYYEDEIEDKINTKKLKSNLNKSRITTYNDEENE